MEKATSLIPKLALKKILVNQLIEKIWPKGLFALDSIQFFSINSYMIVNNSILYQDATREKSI